MAKALVIKGANFSENKLATITLDEAVPCTGITLDKAASSIDGIGTTDTLTATVSPSECTEVVSWATSDDSVATISNGIVTAVGIGTATITATCGSYSATCAVTVTATPDYVLVAGYIPERRSSDGPAATTGKKTDSTNHNHILALNSVDTSIYPIESKTDVDTSPWRFVPILIPDGVSAIKISTTDETTTIKTRILFFNRNAKETVSNTGALCLDGKTAVGGFDQSTWETTQTIEVPSTSGVNSFGGLVYLKESSGNAYEDYADLINVEFLTD